MTPPPRRQGRLDRTKVDLRLPGPGHPVEEGDPETPRRKDALQGGDGDTLLGIEGVRLRGDELTVGKVVGVCMALHPRHGLQEYPAVDQGLR